jgi:hypothetical protein
MLRTARRHSRSIAVLGAGLVAGAVLTGCADQPRTATAAATGPAETSAPTSTPPSASSELAAGLLPAEAFGEGADVDVLPFDGVPYFGHWDHWDHWGYWGHDDESVTPAECQTALDEASTQIGDVQDAAGQVARADGTRTFEVLAVPAVPVEPGEAVAQFQAVVDACGAVSFTEDHGDADHGDVQVSIAPLDVPDGMAGVSVNFSGTYPDGSWAASSLMGIAQDGDRVLLLAQMSHDEDTALDPAAFTALLRQAYDVQADALD